MRVSLSPRRSHWVPWIGFHLILALFASFLFPARAAFDPADQVFADTVQAITNIRIEEGSLTRYQAAEMLAKADQCESADDSGLSDVKAAYKGFVDCVVKAGYFKGTAKKTFEGDRVIHRDEWAAVAGRYAGLVDLSNADEIQKLLSVYVDQNGIDPGLRGALASATKAGLFKGFSRTDGKREIRSKLEIERVHAASAFVKAIAAKDGHGQEFLQTASPEDLQEIVFELFEIDADSVQSTLAKADENVVTSTEITASALDQTVKSVPRGSSGVVLARFELKGSGKLQQITVQRTGVGNTSDFAQIYAFWSEGGQPAKRVSANQSLRVDQQATFTVDVPLNSSAILEIRGDVSTTAGALAQHAFRLISIKTADKMFSFPTSDDRYLGKTIELSSIVIGTVVIRNNGALNDLYVGQKQAEITRFELQLNSQEKAYLRSITLQVRGGINPGDIENFKLYMVGKDEPLAEVKSMSADDLLFFHICTEGQSGCTAPLLLKGSTSVLYVKADLVKAENNRTLQMAVDEAVDVYLQDAAYGFGLQVNASAYLSTANIYGADVLVSFVGPTAGSTLAGQNGNILARWTVSNNSGGDMTFKDWTARLFNTVNANLLPANRRFTNMRLAVLKDGKEVETLFSSVDIDNATAVTAPAAAVVNGTNGFEVTITFRGSYQLLAGKSVEVAFIADLQSTLTTSGTVATLEALANATGSITKIKDQNNDTLTASSVKPSSDIPGNIRTIQSTAISAGISPVLGNPSVALGEKDVPVAAWVFRAGSGTDVNFSRMNVSVIAGPATGAGLVANARATFLQLYLKIDDQVVSDMEGIDTNGLIAFDNLNGKLKIARDAAKDVMLMAVINTSGVVTNGTPYQFQINAQSGVALDSAGVTISAAAVFPSNIAGQLTTINTGGTLLISNVNQPRGSYVSQNSVSDAVVDALLFKAESQNATSRIKSINVDVDTGIAGVENLVVLTVPANGETLTITQPAGVNGVGAFPAITCTITFATAGAADTNCKDHAALIRVDVDNTVTLLASRLRSVTSHLFQMSGSGNGVVVTHTAPAVDGNFTYGGSGLANFSTSTMITGQRSGQSAGKLVVTGVPANGQTLIIGDSANATICTVSFITGGPSDSSCDMVNGGTAVIDISANNTAALVAARLGELGNILGYEAITSDSTTVSIVHTFSIAAVTTAFTGTGLGSFDVLNAVPGTSSVPNTASSMLSQAFLLADGTQISQAVTINNHQIQFRSVNYDFKVGVPVTFTIQVKPKQVVSGAATAGQTFRLFLRRNMFQTVQGGSILTKSGLEVNPTTSPVHTASAFTIQRAVPSFESGGALDSNLLSVGNLQLLKVKINKSGVGTVEIGSGLPQSQFQVELTKSAAVVINRCEVRDINNTILAQRSGPFDSDAFGNAFGNQAAQDAATSVFITFRESDFESGKRIGANSEVYTVYCSVTGFNNGSSVQMSMHKNLRLFFMDNETSVLNQASQFFGLPIDGTPRVSNN